MTEAWLTKTFVAGDRVGTVTLVPANPTKGFKAAVRVEMLGPHESLYLRGPALKALLDFINEHPTVCQGVLDGTL